MGSTAGESAGYRLQMRSRSFFWFPAHADHAIIYSRVGEVVLTLSICSLAIHRVGHVRIQAAFSTCCRIRMRGAWYRENIDQHRSLFLYPYPLFLLRNNREVLTLLISSLQAFFG